MGGSSSTIRTGSGGADIAAIVPHGRRGAIPHLRDAHPNAPGKNQLLPKEQERLLTSFPFARWLAGAAAALGCAAPLLAQTPDCASSPNAVTDYLLGDAQGAPGMAMHWASGLVWQRCQAGQTFDDGQCTGTALEAGWNDWAVTHQRLPQSFANQEAGGIPVDFVQDLLVSGDWRMAYAREYASLNCKVDSFIQQSDPLVFPSAYTWVWTGSPHPWDPDQSSAKPLSAANYTGTARTFPLGTLLVRGGQPFAAFPVQPFEQSGPANGQVTFAPVTLGASNAAGTAWGGARIDNGAFQIDGTGPWLTKAIVHSGQTLTVRLDTGAQGTSRTATLTLRSGLTTGTITAGAGSESTAAQTTAAQFVANAAQAGGCGTAAGTPALLAPTAGLCSPGTPGGMSDADPAAFAWNCVGPNGGSTASCSAPRQYTAAASVDPATGGNTAACTPATVTHGGGTTCTATPGANYQFTSWSGACSGSGPCTPTVQGPTSAVAHFSLKTYAIATGSPTNGAITCTPNPVEHGSSATCTASPSHGYRFDHWTGHCSGTGACALSNVTGPRSVSAQFSAIPAPAAPQIDPASGGTTGAARPAISGSAEPGSTVEVFSGATSLGTATADAVTGAWSLTPAAPLPTGPHTLTATAANAGGTSPASAPLALDVALFDAPTGGPRVTITSSINGCVLDTPPAFAPADLAGAPMGATAPLGALAFTATQCANGTLTVQIAYPSGSLAGLAPYKWGPASQGATPGWFPHGTVSGDVVTYAVTDDGTGDGDTANGAISDPHAMLLLAAPGAHAIPTLGGGAMALLSLLAAALGAVGLRRRG
jgi:hypothetical protein